MNESVRVEPGRLNGWKEIAVHVCRGARTVQRWEKIYGLPVHRIGREGGEIVYAFRDEIDAWMATSTPGRAGGDDDPSGAMPPDVPATPASEAPHARHPRARWLVPVLVLAGSAFFLAGAWGLRPAARAGESTQPVSAAIRQPAAWRLVNESLVVLDLSGALLFEHRFGSPLRASISSESPPGHVGPVPVAIADVDGDGRSEVLVNVNTSNLAQRKLYCFESDGRVRFVYQSTGTRRFGEDEYGEPWLGHRAFVTQGLGGTRRLWAVFTHGLLFPAVLQELDPRDGAVRQEYWSNGYIEMVREVTWSGRTVLLVGGTNNDFRAASLAVFPPDGLAGSTPAVRPAYGCRDCAPGGPEALFLFPTLCFQGQRGQATVLDAWVEKVDHLRVRVGQGDSSLGDVSVFYTLGPGGALLGGEISRDFQGLHALLERQGILDHRFGPRDDAEMFPVRRWDGNRFVDLPPVKVAH